MPLADVYHKFPIAIERAKGCYLYDQAGQKIVDFYSGHGVISIGHQHPHFIDSLKEQMSELVYYSNAVQLKKQEELADRLAQMSGYPDYNLFLVNSGAEAVENALKIAAFETGRRSVISFRGAFHGRTSLAVQCTDSDAIKSPLNQDVNIRWATLNDIDSVKALLDEDVCAVIIEGIQGVGGIHIPETSFLLELSQLCKSHGTLLIIDEIQSGFARSGRFFAHQWSGVRADIITMAKGMGNGFPIGGLLINNQIALKKGMLGTTFGGNPMASAACLAVLQVIENDHLAERASDRGCYLMDQLKDIEKIQNIRGKGLMIGFDIDQNSSAVRSRLLFECNTITGSAKTPETIRLLPPLCIDQHECETFIRNLNQILW